MSCSYTDLSSSLEKIERIYHAASVSISDCIECMACSDNTVRAGLTPKFKDAETLCSDLTFEMSPPQYLRPKDIASGLRIYAPPVDEFAVYEIRVSQLNLQRCVTLTDWFLLKLSEQNSWIRIYEFQIYFLFWTVLIICNWLFS